jgi:hypothetical protein
VRRSLEIGGDLAYRSNETGFGWTDAGFTRLIDELPPETQKQLLAAYQAMCCFARKSRMAA